LNAVLAAVAILLLLAGVPIGFALMGCAAFVISAANLTTPDIVPRVMTSTTDNFVFIAIPFFVFAGLLLTNTGVSESIARLIANLLGRRSGGFLYVIVICMYIMSGLSGSKTADTVAVGTPLGDMLERYGFSREEGAGVLTAATVMGETVPPSLPILILGSVTTLSIGALFSAGLLPAAVLAVCLLALIWFRSRGDSAEAMPRFSFRSLGRNAFLAIPGLCLPGILVGGIVGGIATPTEVSSFAVLYGVLLIFLYRTGVRMFWHTMQTALVMSGMLLFILPAAAAFSWLLTYAEIPQDVARAAIRVHGQPWIFVIVSILLFIFFGAALEGAAAIIVLAPIMVPAAAAVGINPLQYGIVLIIAMGIGTHLPLVGVGYYVACTAMKVPIHRVIGRTFAYLAIVLAGLVLIAFYSPFTLIVPRWMGLQ
jgi:tripartite ATP-independent transporter DctM subunit